MKGNIILGVTGSIAAYKAAELASRLTKLGYSVHVIMTRSAQEFITPLTFQTITGNKVHIDMFPLVEAPEVHHISLAKGANLVLFAPATANLMGKLANGIADDMLTTVSLAAWQKPRLLCPAMNTAMYDNPITQKNLQTLRDLGCRVVEPREALLACGDLGRGALAEVEDIVKAAVEILEAGYETH